MEKTYNYNLGEFYGVEVKLFDVLNSILLKNIYVCDDVENRYITVSNKENSNLDNVELRSYICKILTMGRGVLYKNKIMFASKANSLKQLNEFIKKYGEIKKIMNEDSFTGKLIEPSKRMMVRTYLNLFKNQIWSRELTIDRLSKYFISKDYLIEILDSSMLLNKVTEFSNVRKIS